MKTGKYPFVMCNFAPPDMVGHTGVYDAAVVACAATGIIIILYALKRCSIKSRDAASMLSLKLVICIKRLCVMHSLTVIHNHCDVL